MTSLFLFVFVQLFITVFDSPFILFSTQIEPYVLLSSPNPTITFIFSSLKLQDSLPFSLISSFPWISSVKRVAHLLFIRVLNLFGPFTMLSRDDSPHFGYMLVITWLGFHPFSQSILHGQCIFLFPYQSSIFLSTYFIFKKLLIHSSLCYAQTYGFCIDPVLHASPLILYLCFSYVQEHVMI